MQTQPSDLPSQPTTNQPSVPAPANPAPKPNRLLGALKRFPWIPGLIFACSVCGVGYMIYLLVTRSNNITVGISTFLALLPAVLVVCTFVFLARWLPMPKYFLALAFLWGAGIATVVSLWGNTWADNYFATYNLGPSIFDAQSLTSVFVAPFLEEATKGLGVLVILILARRYLLTPLDGVVVAGIVAGGFAFIENVLYFVQFSSVLPGVFFLRGVMGPFGHSIYTSLTGLAMATAYTRVRQRWLLVPIGVLGYLSAVFLHGLWNGLATYNALVFAGSYFGWWVPFFTVWLAILIFVSVKQKTSLDRGVQIYVGLGKISEKQSRLLSNPKRQRAYLFLLSKVSPKCVRLSKRLYREFAHLALGYVALTYVSQRKSIVAGMCDASRRETQLLTKLQTEYAAQWQNSVDRRDTYIRKTLRRLQRGAR